MKPLIASLCLLSLATVCAAPAAATSTAEQAVAKAPAVQPGAAGALEVVGKVVALRDTKGELTAVKLLGKDGRIYDVVLDKEGLALAALARQLAHVKGTVVEEKAEGEKPATFRLTVKESSVIELSPSASRGSAM
jgi:hypothetical protein